MKAETDKKNKRTSVTMTNEDYDIIEQKAKKEDWQLVRLWWNVLYIHTKALLLRIRHGYRIL